ncbi:MAG: TetR/AcrR family transcriptional regulator [Chthoniobacterales bacterium]|nr:TetR/AcrR family transcriptional regulator [Chthoniobacterales bacterium]
MVRKKSSDEDTNKLDKESVSQEFRVRVIAEFIKQWSEDGDIPKSVYRFCKAAKIEEDVFYDYFSSLKAVEKAFWKQWIDNVIEAVSRGDEWQSFSTKERYLSFLFAVVASSLKYRSLLLDRFSEQSSFSNPSSLEGVRRSFMNFAEELIRYGKEAQEIADRRNLVKLYPHLLYLHLRLVLNQLLKDESDDYQQTDAFIEKTVTLAFDLFRSQALESASDLIKFFVSSKFC